MTLNKLIPQIKNKYITYASRMISKLIPNDLRFSKLPYDNTNPIIYDKDEIVNNYTEDYLMSLASAGDIQFAGIITSSTLVPHNPHVTESDYSRIVKQRCEAVNLARISGLRNIPDPVLGPKGNLIKPSSGEIEDTQPIDSPGSRLILQAAHNATIEKPLVVIMGGALTAVADAYLMDKRIADRLIVSWIGGNTDSMNDYNGQADTWAAYIVISRLQLVQFPAWRALPTVKKSDLLQLPDTPYREWVINKRHDRWKTPDGVLQPGMYDGDAPPAISVMRNDYVIKTKRVSFDYWLATSNGDIPVFKKDRYGKTLIVTMADSDIATNEWWRAMTNPSVYTTDPN